MNMGQILLINLVYIRFVLHVMTKEWGYVHVTTIWAEWTS